MQIGEKTTGMSGYMPKNDITTHNESAVMLTLGSRLSFEDAKVVSQYSSWNKSLNNIWE